MDYDLVIIGGGPAGLTAGICAVQRNLRTIIIEADRAGGQPGILYPEKEIYNWPCFHTVTGKDISKNFVENTLKKGCVLKQNEIAENILDVPGGLKVVTNRGSYTGATVIIATGNGFLKPKKLKVPGAEKLEGKGVHYMMPSKQEFAGKNVMFVGGGHSALEMALMVCDVADTCIVHRRDNFRADQWVIEKVKDSKIKTIMDAEVLKIEGGDNVEYVLLKVGGTQKKIAVDMVVIKIGMISEIERLKSWNIELEEDGIKVDQQMNTSRRGVFACGDAVVYPGKYRQIVTSSSEAATASNSALEYVRNL
jgi:ferredoxin/flavodoxin---NADP+ reductase